MMDLNIRSAGIAWAVPVRPDKLGLHLQAFKEFLPKLTALRLCHRFGKGTDAHITKIPLEILNVIETYTFDPDYVFWDEWDIGFTHYESKCDPLFHLYDDRVLDMRDEFRDHECSNCQDYNWHLCTEKCDETTTELANEYMMTEHDWRERDCEGWRQMWEAMINQKPKGNFVQYDQLLRKHFGLEAFFATTRRPEGDTVKWPDHPNYKWHVGQEEEIQTTICYLTLPRQAAKGHSFPVSEMEAECGSAFVQGLHSSFIRPPDLLNRNKRVKQFRRALRTLKLKPCVHPSQLQDTVQAEAPRPSAESKEEDESGGKNSSQESLDPEKVEWPQLIMLVEGTSSWP